MPQKMSLEQLEGLLNNLVVQAQSAAKELHEIQVQFVSAYQESKSQHDATLEDLTARALKDLSSLPQDLRKTIQERVEVERQTLEKRRQDLRENVIPQAEKAADDLLAENQRQTAQIRELNPRLNQEEEGLKKARTRMETELNDINAQIKARSGCLKSLFNFFKILELDRQRQKLLGRMEGNAHNLNKIREEWAKARAEFQSKETQLEQVWQEASLQAAKAREELAQLDDDQGREALVLKRAIFYSFDQWKSPLGDGGSALVGEINRMVQLNIQTDAYQEGLGKVAGLIALLGGVDSSLNSLGNTVQALIREQQMHSAYLRQPQVNIGDEVLRFKQYWVEFGKKIADEKTIGKNPQQFSVMFAEEVGGILSETNLKNTFSSIGRALDEATRGWKG